MKRDIEESEKLSSLDSYKSKGLNTFHICKSTKAYSRNGNFICDKEPPRPSALTLFPSFIDLRRIKFWKLRRLSRKFTRDILHETRMINSLSH